MPVFRGTQKKLRIAQGLTWAVFVYFLSLGAAAQISPPIRSFQLVAPNVGWASSGDAVFWTTDDGGSWRNITPSVASLELTSSMPNVRDVFFLDAEKGWVLLSDWRDRERADAPEISVAFTENAGVSWTVTAVSISDFDSGALAGYGHLHFIDSGHGWLNLDLAGSSNANFGLLLETADGGRTWSKVTNGPHIAGPILFENANDGWVAGGPGNHHLFATHDGGKSWQELSLNPPQGVGSATYPTYDVPKFVDNNGFLPVTYAAQDDSNSAVVVFSTADNGRTWVPKNTTTLSHATSLSARIPTAVSKTPAGEVSLGAVEEISGSKVLKIEYLDSQLGWASTWKGLQATADGGATWTDISPVRSRLSK
jgi:photosystem II stability/assembly factor-like uncharacterized protein